MQLFGLHSESCSVGSIPSTIFNFTVTIPGFAADGVLQLICSKSFSNFSKKLPSTNMSPKTHINLLTSPIPRPIIVTSFPPRGGPKLGTKLSTCCGVKNRKGVPELASN